METTLHRVAESELSNLKDWLELYLPDSHKVYHTVAETIRGRWRGTTFYTLGWPDILAVGEGEVDAEKSRCARYYSEPRTTSVFSPLPEHMERLLNCSGFLDWSQPIIFHFVSRNLRDTIQKVGRANGGKCLVVANVMLTAGPKDLPARPVPEGFDIRPLGADLHTDYVASTWPNARPHADVYIRELLRRFPSVGLFDRHNECIGLEIVNEYGSLGMLYVRPEFRRRGLGKVITSHLAQKHFRGVVPAVAFSLKSNETSLRMHKDCGFRETTDVDWILYQPRAGALARL